MNLDELTKEEIFKIIKYDPIRILFSNYDNFGKYNDSGKYNDIEIEVVRNLKHYYYSDYFINTHIKSFEAKALYYKLRAVRNIIK
jgi:flavorubredoxin